MTIKSSFFLNCSSSNLWLLYKTGSQTFNFRKYYILNITSAGHASYLCRRGMRHRFMPLYRCINVLFITSKSFFLFHRCFASRVTSHIFQQRNIFFHRFTDASPRCFLKSFFSRHRCFVSRVTRHIFQ